MAVSEKRVTIQRACIQRLGIHRGAIAAARVAQWSIAAAELGHMPTTVEYAEWWAIGERSAWRHRALIHAALGEEWQAVVEQLADVARSKSLRSPRAVQQLELAL